MASARISISSKCMPSSSLTRDNSCICHEKLQSNGVTKLQYEGGFVSLGVAFGLYCDIEERDREQQIEQQL